ncbi:MAG: hypothetical protein COS94_05125 [Candidatus Hydrogenedentes bacterium CG07_land_8_20_14_0_80_42_17]|nr:MAG: hypothetical protein COS94_05125 [Candidatus Hydrogenedentes bacterium CG07_land_8_20_14_0_80_42_17]
MSETLISIQSPMEIDLDSNGIIVASAGTGKTYTLENLFLRILVEKRLPIEKILAVTFTEKSAAEMRDRIRRRLSERIREMSATGNNSGELRHFLDETINNFRSANISTIHGFCNKILNEFPFETGAAPDRTLIDDKQVLSDAFEELKSHFWREINLFGCSSEEILELYGFGQKFDERILELSQKYIPSWITLLPSLLKPDEYLKEIQKIIKKLFEWRDTKEFSNFVQRFSLLNFNASSRKSIVEKILSPLCSELQESKSWIEFAISFIRLSKSISYGRFEDNSYLCIIPDKWNKSGSNLDSVAPEVPELSSKLEGLHKAITNFQMSSYMELIKRTRETADAIKISRGWMTYQDMILEVESAISRSSDLKNLLKERFNYVLIDEAQDTDGIQWSIFRSIFLEDKEHKIFLIGDPKQSIYRFRGADIESYFEAAKEISENGGKTYSLSITYRHPTQLIECFNNLFSDGWFEEKVYIPVKSADEEKRPYAFLDKKSSDPSFNAVEINSSGRAAKAQFGEFIAKKILEITKDPPIIAEFCDYKERIKRRLRLSDIAVLISTWNEANELEETFKAHDIPCMLYKKTGIFHSRESQEILYLLAALSNQGNDSHCKKAFLTSFFSLTGVGIAEENVFNSAKEKLNKWRSLLDVMPIGAAFQEIIDDSGLISRVAVYQDRERRISNYRQVIEYLESKLSGRRSVWKDIYDELLNEFSRNEIEKDEEDLYRIESDIPKVMIMTIHVSKGLEFPIVFIAGGITSKHQLQTLPFHAGEKGVSKLAMDLSSSSDGILKIEDDYEKRRLYYVAFTRAIFRVYVPKIICEKQHSPGPMVNFVKNNLQKIVLPNESCYTKSMILDDCEIPEEKATAIDFSRIQLTKPELSERIRRMNSFSSMIRNEIYFEETSISEFEKDEYEENIIVEPNSEKDLRPGRKTGLMLHKIMEELEYERFMAFKDYRDAIADKKVRECIIRNQDIYFQSNEEREADTEKIAGIIWSCLRVKFLEEGKCLAEIPKRDRISEVDFLEASSSESMMTGKIDLVFRLDGKYYLLDWKSNLIADYSYDSLQAEIIRNRYDIQRDVYLSAAKKWFSARIKNFKYEKEFGGMYYVFMRGLKPDDLRSGVLYFKTDSE